MLNGGSGFLCERFGGWSYSEKNIHGEPMGSWLQLRILFPNHLIVDLLVLQMGNGRMILTLNSHPSNPHSHSLRKKHQQEEEPVDV